MGNHRRFALRPSHYALDPPSPLVHDAEGGVGLSEADEFERLNWYGTNFGKGRKFQRRVTSNSQASYGFTRALTPILKIPSEPLEDEAPPAPVNASFYQNGDQFQSLQCKTVRRDTRFNLSLNRVPSRRSPLLRYAPPSNQSISGSDDEDCPRSRDPDHADFPTQPRAQLGGGC